MNGHGKSDRPMVPAKLPNNDARASAEAMEGRGLAKGNLRGQNAAAELRAGNVCSVCSSGYVGGGRR